MVKAVLMDIEGTTTSISFVHDTLFPYARRALKPFLQDHEGQAEVEACLASVRETVFQERGIRIEPAQTADVLLQWMDEDRKHTALKALQGMMWRRGYEEGHFTAHLYDDVKPCMERWHARGVTLAIYSSGSIAAQRLLFGHTPSGDLTTLISHYFDTTSGPKKETESYRTIARSLAMATAEILFLSDVEAELDAAADAGLQTAQLVRPGTAPGNRHPKVEDFTQIAI